MVFRESTVEVLDQPVAIDNREEHAVQDLEELFAASGAEDFKVGVSELLRQTKGSETELERILSSLRDLEVVINVVKPVDSNRERSSLAIKELPELHRLYADLIKPRFRERTTFTDFLYGYLQEAIKVFNLKHAKYLAQKGKAGVQAARWERDKERQELEVRIRQDLIETMEQRTPRADYPSAQRAEINRFEQKLARRSEFLNKDERRAEQAYNEEIHELELLLGALLEKNELFGQGAKVWHADKYDDYFNHADLVVATDGGPTLMIDLTYSLSDIGEKLYYNQQQPLRSLHYPPVPELKDRHCLPVVLGLSQSDAEEAIDALVAAQAKEKVGGQTELSKLPLNGLERWYDYILIQLQHQREYIEVYTVGTTPGKEADRYSSAIEQYNRAIIYFEKLKKERCPSLQLDRQRAWDNKFLSLDGTISDFETRAGLADDPPDLPETVRAA